MDYVQGITPEERWKNDKLNELRRQALLLEQIAQLLNEKVSRNEESVVTGMTRKVNKIINAGIAQKMSLQGGDEFHMHPPADETRNGFMTVEDGKTMNGATLSPRPNTLTPNTLMKRNPSGRAEVSEPLELDNIARKQEVDKVEEGIVINITSNVAHPTEHISYSGEVIGARNVKQTIDKTDSRIDSLILNIGDGTPEVIDARGGFPLLGDRLDAFDNNMAGIVSVTNFNTFASAIDHLKTLGGGILRVPKGTYNESFKIDSGNIALKLDDDAVIDGKISIKGEGVGKSNSVSFVGDWSVFPSGTSVFNGDFSAFGVGDVVMIETGIQNATYNQTGIDFGTVASASRTNLMIDLPTKFAYNNPTISKVSGAMYVTGSISADDSSITGNFTNLLSVGAIVRFENRSGDGGADSSTAYFEINKVVSISSTAVVFENKFTHSFTDYWIVKLNYIDNVSISGGKINTLEVEYVSDFKIDGTKHGLTNDGEFYTVSLKYIYEFYISTIDVEVISKPIGVELVYCYNGFVSGVVVSGARGSTDNANLKLMSCINVALDTVVSTDTKSSSAEAVIPFIIDYYYTPYKCWNDKLVIDSITATGNKNQEDLTSPDFWAIGVRNSIVSGVACNNPIRISNNLNVIYSDLINDSTLFLDQGCVSIAINNFKCGSLDIVGLVLSTISNGILTSKDAVLSRVIYLHGNTRYVKLKEIYVSLSAYTTLYIQNSEHIEVDGISDQAAGEYSVFHGDSATNVRYGTNFFAKATPSNTSSIAPTKHYGIPKGVIVPFFVLGRNSYSDKGAITGDGTEYKCVFDGDGLNTYNKNNVTDLSKFTVPGEAAGNYMITASIGLEGLGSSHNLAELYLLKNGTQKYYLDYRQISLTGSLYLNGTIVLPLLAADYLELCVKVAGSSRTITWPYSEMGGQLSGTLLFAE
ncbi:hypothetical protein MKY82_31045 [Paenibacillus sp. FSL W7-1279]|uniref:hypothetical protein n=1 Tax=Paenibacillus sp. FSL W7-1279 TaxID=2921697 RepID=UPI0030DB6F32